MRTSWTTATNGPATNRHARTPLHHCLRRPRLARRQQKNSHHGIAELESENQSSELRKLSCSQRTSMMASSKIPPPMYCDSMSHGTTFMLLVYLCPILVWDTTAVIAHPQTKAIGAGFQLATEECQIERNLSYFVVRMFESKTYQLLD